MSDAPAPQPQELPYADWLATLPPHEFHNEYNAQYLTWNGSNNNYDHDTVAKMGALRAEETRRGVRVTIGPDMEAGDELEPAPPARTPDPDDYPDYLTPVDMFANSALRGLLAAGHSTNPQDFPALASAAFAMGAAMVRERARYFQQYPVGTLPGPEASEGFVGLY